MHEMNRKEKFIEFLGFAAVSMVAVLILFLILYVGNLCGLPK